MWYYTLTWQIKVYFTFKNEQTIFYVTFLQIFPEKCDPPNHRCLLPFLLLTVGILQSKLMHVRWWQEGLCHIETPHTIKKKVQYQVGHSHCLKTAAHFFPALGLILPAQASTLVRLFCFTSKALQKLQKQCWKNHLTFIQSMRTSFSPCLWLWFFFLLFFGEEAK